MLDAAVVVAIVLWSVVLVYTVGRTIHAIVSGEEVTPATAAEIAETVASQKF